MNEKLKELKAELAKLTDAIAEIEKHCKEEKEFEKGQEYWFVEIFGGVGDYEWENDETDKGALALNNAFHTKKEAEQRLEYLKAEATLRRFMKGKPKGNFIPYYTIARGEFNWTNATSVYSPKFLYSDVQTIKELITTHERELKIYFEVNND